MKDLLHVLRSLILLASALLGGAALGALLTFIWDLYRGSQNANLYVMAGIAMTYALFGAIPAILIGLPAISFFKRKLLSRWQATAALTIGGGVVGALLIFVTFGGFRGFGSFEQLGAIAGASIGFMLGLLVFTESAVIDG